MRLRTKIMLCFLLTTTLVVSVSTWVVNARLSDVTLDNKTREYEVYIRQTLNATVLVMKDIESSLYGLYSSMELARSVNDGERLPR